MWCQSGQGFLRNFVVVCFVGKCFVVGEFVGKFLKQKQ